MTRAAPAWSAGFRLPRARILVSALLCLAPVPGDIGSCGQRVQLLDEEVFFRAKKNIDCHRCEACHVVTASCEVACDPSEPPVGAFPSRCQPLVHDGEVCLRRLQYASCDEYETYMSDGAPSIPSECDFCPGEGP